MFRMFMRTNLKIFCFLTAVTSHTRAAILIGRFVAASSAQLLDYFGVMNYHQLNYLTLASKLNKFDVNSLIFTKHFSQLKYWRFAGLF